MTRADVLEAFHCRMIAKTVRTSETKSCQLQASGPPFIVWHPLWDKYKGWEGASVLSTRRRRETFVRWWRFVVESWTHRLSTDWQNQLGSVCLSACVCVCSQHPCVVPLLPVQNGKIWCFLSPSRCRSLTSIVLFSFRWCYLSFFHSASILFPYLPLLLTSHKFLRCASSCVAPSDPTARNTCNQRQRNREQLVSLLPIRGKVVCFADWAKCCC